jgi:hypothetical protein
MYLVRSGHLHTTGSDGRNIKAKNMKREHSELLRLFDQRYKEQGLGTGSWKRPEWTDVDLDRIRDAATVHGDAHKSDPFARGRMLLHLGNGYDNSSDVLAAARGIIAARSVKHGLVTNSESNSTNDPE